uniref:Uncharacterized protein n=1 Tax=Rhodopseudomonas palustris (strain BisA53) TaxID=316055 RepID=Q07JE9_RHOP5
MRLAARHRRIAYPFFSHCRFDDRILYRRHLCRVYRVARDEAGELRIGYSAHWREENDNPALASFLKLLGEHYPLPLKAA